MSACPTGRWAIPRSATPISAPAASSCRICRASTQAIADGQLAKMPALREFIAELKKSGGTAHLLGLMSPGGVHSHQDQIAALARIARRGRRAGRGARLSRRPRHAAAKRASAISQNSRPTSPGSSMSRSPPSAAAITRWIATSAGTASRRPIATLVEAEGETRRRRRSRRSRRPMRAARPTSSCCRPRSATMPGMRDGDGVLLRQFPRRPRARDRRGLARSGFLRLRARHASSRFAAALGLVEYSTELNRFLATLFPPEDLSDTFGEVVSRGRADAAAHRRDREIRACHVLLQWRARDGISRRGAHPGAVAQGRDLRSAAGDVGARSDRQGGRRRSMPAASMSSCVNYANTDMVGHTGDLDAAIKAVETVDRCLGRLAEAVEARRRHAAHHRRSRQCRDDARPEDRRAAYRAHLNPVPLVLVNPPAAIAGIEQRPARRHRADPAGAARPRAAGGDDRPCRSFATRPSVPTSLSAFDARILPLLVAALLSLARRRRGLAERGSSRSRSSSTRAARSETQLAQQADALPPSSTRLRGEASPPRRRRRSTRRR